MPKSKESAESRLSSHELLILARDASGVARNSVGPGEEARLMALREVALEREAAEAV